MLINEDNAGFHFSNFSNALLKTFKFKIMSSASSFEQRALRCCFLRSENIVTHSILCARNTLIDFRAHLPRLAAIALIVLQN